MSVCKGVCCCSLVVKYGHVAAVMAANDSVRGTGFELVLGLDFLFVLLGRLDDDDDDDDALVEDWSSSSLSFPRDDTDNWRGTL